MILPSLEQSHPTACAPPNPDPARCLSANASPLSTAARDSGLCNSLRRWPSAPGGRSTILAHASQSAGILCRASQSKLTLIAARADFRDLRKPLLLLLSPFLRCCSVLLPTTYYCTGRLWPPRAVSAPMPRCRFGVAPYTAELSVAPLRAYLSPIGKYS